MSTDRETRLDELDTARLDSSGVPVYQLPSRASRTFTTILREQGTRPYWLTSRPDLLSAVNRDGGKPLAERTLTAALADLVSHDLIERGHLGRQLMLKVIVEPGTFAIRVIGALAGRDVIRSAGRARIGAAAIGDSGSWRRRPSEGHVSHVPSMSSSESSSSSAAAASDTAAASRSSAAAIDTLAEDAASQVAAMRAAALGSPHPAIAAALSRLDVEAEPAHLALIAALSDDERVIFWQQMEEWGAGKPSSYLPKVVVTAIRKANPPTTAAPQQAAPPAPAQVHRMPLTGWRRAVGKMIAAAGRASR